MNFVKNISTVQSWTLTLFPATVSNCLLCKCYFLSHIQGREFQCVLALLYNFCLVAFSTWLLLLEVSTLWGVKEVPHASPHGKGLAAGSQAKIQSSLDTIQRQGQLQKSQPTGSRSSVITDLHTVLICSLSGTKESNCSLCGLNEMYLQLLGALFQNVPCYFSSRTSF